MQEGRFIVPTPGDFTRARWLPANRGIWAQGEALGPVTMEVNIRAFRCPECKVVVFSYAEERELQ